MIGLYDRHMKLNNTHLLLVGLLVNILNGSEQWKESPEQFKGAEILIEVGSIKRASGAPSKDGFIAYEPIAGTKVTWKSTDKTETPTTYGSLKFVYVKEDETKEFESKYVASGDYGVTRVGKFDPFNHDANLRWDPPKEMKGILWQIDNTWVLVHK